jgi:hypothetical protein
VWFVYELNNAGLSETNLNAAFNGMLIGGVVGGLMGVMRYRKIQRVASDVLRQVEEMRRMD